MQQESLIARLIGRSQKAAGGGRRARRAACLPARAQSCAEPGCRAAAAPWAPPRSGRCWPCCRWPRRCRAQVRRGAAGRAGGRGTAQGMEHPPQSPGSAARHRLLLRDLNAAENERTWEKHKRGETSSAGARRGWGLITTGLRVHCKRTGSEPWGEERGKQGDPPPAPPWKLLPNPALTKGFLQYDVPPLMMQSWVWGRQCAEAMLCLRFVIPALHSQLPKQPPLSV